MKSSLKRILRFLDFSKEGSTLEEITMHTNASNPLLLLELLIEMGFTRKAILTDALGSPISRYFITPKGAEVLIIIRT